MDKRLTADSIATERRMMNVVNSAADVIDDGNIVAWVSLWVSIVTFFITRLEKKRDANRDQAGKVSSWIENAGHDATNAIVVNNSDLPIYGVAIVVEKGPWFYSGNYCERLPGQYYKGSETVCELIPPGRYRVHMPGGDYYGCSAYPSAAIAFTCANGTSWVRESNGRLHRIRKDPFSYLGISVPRPFGAVEALD